MKQYMQGNEDRRKEDGFILSLYMNKDFLTPTCKIYVQCTSIDEFLDYVREDLLNRNLNLTKFSVGEKQT